MASSVNAVLSMGAGALFASQTAIQTTGNNISNVNTPGYSRQAVRLEDMPSLDYRPGQMGQGVRAVEVMRYFNQFVERSYLNTLGDTTRFQAQYAQLTSVESLFNESNTNGVSYSLQQFFNSWENLAQWPDDMAARENVLAKAQTLADLVRGTSQQLSTIANRVTDQVVADVEQCNKLIKEIANLNMAINAHADPGHNNPNSLLDERDQKVRELAALIDVDVIDKGYGDYIVNTKAGHTLVDGGATFKLEVRGSNVERDLSIGSTYTGNMGFGGSDGYEYTVEVAQGGTVGSSGNYGDPANATFKVSLDGGRTWVTNDDGTVKLFNANDSSGMVKVKDLDIWFDAGTLQAGDRFTATPKTAVYWIEPTRGAVNISPRVFADGTVDSRRITGGSIGGNLIFRDYQVEPFRDQLDSFARSLIYEVNRIHSQGAGMTAQSYILGTYQVGRTDLPMGSQESRFTWAEQLQAGNCSFAVYDAVSGENVSGYPGIEAFSGINFDPAVHSLEDVRDAINGGPAGTYVQAAIVDGKLSLTAQPGYTFAITADTTGLAAALGINTFFTGGSAGTMTLNESVVQDKNLINAARVNGAGEFNAGDNITSKDIANLATKALKFFAWTGQSTSQSLTSYYSTLVANVGGATASAKFSMEVKQAMSDAYYEQQSSISGVNLDEEMSNLIRFQSSYKAAAKLITTADQMLQTLLSLKQ